MTTVSRLVLLVETDSSFLEAARVLFAGHRTLTAGDLDEAFEIVLGGRVDLVLLGPTFASDAAIAAAAALTEADPVVSVVLAAGIVTNRLLKSALRASFSDVVDVPLTARSVEELLALPRTDELTEVSVILEQAESEPRTDAVESVEFAEGPAIDPTELVTGETEEGPRTSFEAEPAVARSSTPIAAPPAEPPAEQEPEPSDAAAEAESAGEPIEPELALDRLIPQLPAPEADRAPGAAASPFDIPRRGAGRVIAVMAGKGGSGKTVVATNLAIAIGLRGDPERVAIVDGDLQFGDVALMLQVDPVRTLDDVAGRIDEMSDARLEAALIRHESGIKVLPAPVLPVRGDEIKSKELVAMVERLRTMYDAVVVDTGPVFDDGLVSVLEQADDVVAVVDMDLASVKNAKVVLDRLRVAGFPMERITMVVNRVNSKVRLDLVELERTLRLRVGGSVPSDRLVPQSVNEGAPAIRLSPRSRVARAFHALAETLDPEARRERLTAG